MMIWWIEIQCRLSGKIELGMQHLSKPIIPDCCEVGQIPNSFLSTRPHSRRQSQAISQSVAGNRFMKLRFFLKRVAIHYPISKHQCTVANSLIPNWNSQANCSIIERLKPPYYNWKENTESQKLIWCFVFSLHEANHGSNYEHIYSLTLN